MNAQNTKPLRIALVGNAVFSALSAVILITFSEKVGTLIGTVNYWVLSVIGIGLGIFSADLFHQASRRRMQTWRALYASLGDASWVLGTIILLVWFPQLINEQGRALVIAVALIVALFGCFQFWGAGEAHRLKDSRVYRHCVAVRVSANTTKLWGVISDLSGISKYFPSLRSSFIRDDMKPEVGAIRQCEDHSGKQWAEMCTRFEVGKRIEMEFLCQEVGFPYPAHEMIGGWELIKISETSTEVHIWWELKPKPSFMAPLIMPLLGLKADIDFPPLVFRMAGRDRDAGLSGSLVRRVLLTSSSC